MSKSLGNSNSQSADWSNGFVLSDPDEGDLFDVQIMRDPVYGSPVF